MSRTTSLKALASTLLVMACTQAEPPTDPAEVRAQLDAYLATYASPDASSRSVFLAADIVEMPPDQPATMGATAVQASYVEFFAENDFVLETTVDDLQVSGDLAVARTTFRQSTTPKAGGDTVEDMGSWLIVMSRQDDGSWKVIQEMWSEYPPENEEEGEE